MLRPSTRRRGQLQDPSTGYERPGPKSRRGGVRSVHRCTSATSSDGSAIFCRVRQILLEDSPRAPDHRSRCRETRERGRRAPATIRGRRCSTPYLRAKAGIADARSARASGPQERRDGGASDGHGTGRGMLGMGRASRPHRTRHGLTQLRFRARDHESLGAFLAARPAATARFGVHIQRQRPVWCILARAIAGANRENFKKGRPK